MIVRMTELELAIQVLAGITVAVLGFFLIYAWLQKKVVRQFWCGIKRKPVVATFIASPFHRHYVDVTSCSVFGEGKPVTCDKKCLDPKWIEACSRRAALAGGVSG